MALIIISTVSNYFTRGLFRARSLRKELSDRPFEHKEP